MKSFRNYLKHIFSGNSWQNEIRENMKRLEPTIHVESETIYKFDAVCLKIN